MWLHGFAGCGKSVLCSTAIQYAFRHRRSNPRIAIAFFFFDINDKSKQDVSAMLRALILRLSAQLKNGGDPLSDLYTTYSDTTPPDNVLMDCLHSLIGMFDHVYIFLDGLDESPRGGHRKDVLQALVDIKNWSEKGLHLLVTSREETDIWDAIHELGVSDDGILSMENESVYLDIARLYIREPQEDGKVEGQS